MVRFTLGVIGLVATAVICMSLVLMLNTAIQQSAHTLEIQEKYRTIRETDFNRANTNITTEHEQQLTARKAIAASESSKLQGGFYENRIQEPQQDKTNWFVVFLKIAGLILLGFILAIVGDHIFNFTPVNRNYY